ncbi:hypothetical protein GQX74_005631 [Glossina fuscipes]|nr:hypothetical protein GQX74_005631 [Glossina fuscipes]
MTDCGGRHKKTTSNPPRHQGDSENLLTKLTVHQDHPTLVPIALYITIFTVRIKRVQVTHLMFLVGSNNLLYFISLVRLYDVVFKKLHINTFLILCLTFGTNINSMLKKQQNITANATKTKDASCCDAITIPTGAVIKHSTTTLYMLMPT